MGSRNFSRIQSVVVVVIIIIIIIIIIIFFLEVPGEAM
jgi:amino acid transporter